MKSSKSNVVFWLLGISLILGFFAILSYTRSGEILDVMEGEVIKCEILGEETVNSLVHATIKSENGIYIIAKL